MRYPGRRRAVMLLVILFQDCSEHAKGFVLSPQFCQTFSRPIPSLYAKPRSKDPSGGAAKKKGPQNKGDKRSLHDKELTKASQRGSVALPSQTSKAPPWQVLGSKEAKLNVEAEKKRRQLAREGIQSEPTEWQSGQKSLSSSLLSDAERQIVKWKRFNPSTVPCGMTFIGSYLEKRLPPRLGVPEVAFLGRSNVGKSSLLNRLSAPALTGNSVANDEARVGKTPGATASVNLYVMLGKANQKTDAKAILGLADLPGFGYAKLSKEVQAAVQQAAERYLNNREELALCILLVDARRVPSDDDRAVLAALYDLGLPIVVAATKVDKLSRNEVDTAMAIIQERLGLPDGQPLCVSSVTGEGTKQMWRIIMEACETKVEELTQKLQRVGSKDGDVESIQLDDEGNLIQPDEDEDIAYDQGYDWIQNSNIVYDYGEVDTEAFSATDEEDYFDYSDVSESDSKESESLKFKDLKRKIRRMERRGEI